VNIDRGQFVYPRLERRRDRHGDLHELAPVGGLPKMRRAGQADVSGLKVSVSELTSVSEPLYAVA
jgi:hypothetical protein